MTKEPSEDVIKKWLTVPGSMPLLKLATKLDNSIQAIPAGEVEIRKSKWKLVNWYRKLTNTEKKEKVYKFIWTTPK